MIPVIALIFLPRGKVFDQALEQAIAAGTVTEKLSAAFRDRVVTVAHTYELVITVVIILLMVLKPF
jgi:hypothetical protein